MKTYVAFDREKIAVQCQECDKKFQTISTLPTCPKCKGSDIDLAKEAK